MTNIPPMNEPVSKRRPLPFLGGILVVVVVVVGGATVEEATVDEEEEGETTDGVSFIVADDETFGVTFIETDSVDDAEDTLMEDEEGMMIEDEGMGVVMVLLSESVPLPETIEDPLVFRANEGDGEMDVLVVLTSGVVRPSTHTKTKPKNKNENIWLSMMKNLKNTGNSFGTEMAFTSLFLFWLI